MEQSSSRLAHTRHLRGPVQKEADDVSLLYCLLTAHQRLGRIQCIINIINIYLLYPIQTVTEEVFIWAVGSQCSFMAMFNISFLTCLLWIFDFRFNFWCPGVFCHFISCAVNLYCSDFTLQRLSFISGSCILLPSKPFFPYQLCRHRRSFVCWISAPYFQSFSETSHIYHSILNNWLFSCWFEEDWRIENCKNQEKKLNLRVIITNADGLFNKKYNLSALVNSSVHKPDVIAVTEIKPKSLTQKLLASEFHLDGYNVFCQGLEVIRLWLQQKFAYW